MLQFQMQDVWRKVKRTMSIIIGVHRHRQQRRKTQQVWWYCSLSSRMILLLLQLLLSTTTTMMMMTTMMPTTAVLVAAFSGPPLQPATATTTTITGHQLQQRPIPAVSPRRRRRGGGGGKTGTSTSSSRMINTVIDEGQFNGALLFWITAFATSHIGMSAIRQTLITDVFGNYLARDVLGLVDTGTNSTRIQLPDFWPGDTAGNILFPDVETTGRQLYRLFYTSISFLTLGTAFQLYLAEHTPTTINTINSSSHHPICYLVATLAGACSLASLANASPLGLMPSFRRTSTTHPGPDDREGEESEIEVGRDKNTAVDAATSSTTATVTATTNNSVAGATVWGMTREDGLKFVPKGLTRITRHPLILPVVPWGCATALLVGGQANDCILFGGLAVYAIAGCYCQDLRVVRQEGSVGTTFLTGGGEEEQEETRLLQNSERQQLHSFYQQTSFLPFGAVWDGRQSGHVILQEFPLVPFVLAIPASWCLETLLLQFLAGGGGGGGGIVGTGIQ